ncbi:hypothetical protein C8R45DRAFT_311816 [Mycena sanguinolenta]|nr:hypothetical protein C8R45DRAFT_311816 [Mycena sanguinolenta]
MSTNQHTNTFTPKFATPMSLRVRSSQSLGIAKRSDHRKKSDQEYNDESMRMIAETYPDLLEEQHRELLQYTLARQSPMDAVYHFGVLLKASKMNTVFGAKVPPASRMDDLKSFDFYSHRVFHHPTHPADCPNPGLFTWNFYIGKSGEGVESIDQDAEKTYRIELLDFRGRWGRCKILNVLPRTRVRMLGSGTQVHELVFPPNPNELDVVVHLLPV